MEKTIKYLEDGEYHYATVRAVGDLAKLKTDSKEDLVSAINNLFENSTDPDKAPKPEGYDKLVKEVADAIKGQQDLNEKWDKWQKDDATLTEERKQEYLQNIKSLQDSIDKAKEDASALTDKTNALSDQLTQTFSELDTSIQNMHDQLQKETESISNDLNKTKGDLTKVRTDLQNTQLDNGKIHDSISNINGKFEHKVWEDDLAPMKEQINRNETEVQQTKDQLLEKASQKSVDTLTNTVSNLDTQVKKTAQGLEVTVKKDELGGEIADALNNKTNLLLGTRRFTTNNWQGREHVDILPDTWRGMKVAKQNQPNEGIQQSYQVKADKTYTFSLFAKVDEVEANVRPRLTLAQNALDTSLESKVDVYQNDISDITTDFKRYSITFTPNVDCLIWPHMVSNSDANKPIYVSGYQLEIGKTPTPWEPNQEDVGDYVEKSETQFNVYNDRIQALTEKQRQQGDTQEKLKTEVTQTAEGTRQVSENLKKTNDDITKLRGEFEVKANHMKSEYESYTNKAVGQISDSTLNLIRNSAFQNKDSDFDQWQNVSAKANVRSDENGLRWVELTQSGLTTDNPQGLTSNYFNVKQGKVTIAVDIKSGDKATLDDESVLFLGLYNEAKKRVDFRFVTLSELGLGVSLLGDHKVHRGLYRLGIDRNDAKYMTVKASLTRNGDLYFTNFSARLSSIDDGAYEPNPDDINQQILKQNTKIEQNAKEVAIKANSVDVTRDIKSAVDGIQVGGRNYLRNSDKSITGQAQDLGTLPDEVLNSLAGKTITVSVDVEWNDFKHDSSKQNRLGFELAVRGSNGQSYWLYAWKNPTTTSGSERVSMQYSLPAGVTFTVTNNGRSGYVSINGTGKVSHAKIEVGNRPTDWSPAPEDTSEEIKSAKDAAIKVASDQIDIHVNELRTSFDDKLNKQINEVKTASEKFTSDGIEQTVKKITEVKNNVDGLENRLNDTQSAVNGVSQKLDNIQVGGRNLVPGTAVPYAMGYGIPATTWKDNSAYLELPTTVKQNEILPQDPRSMHYTLIKGTTYTQTVWFETDAKLLKENGLQFTWFTNDGHDGQPAVLVKLGENRYKAFSTYTWPGKNDNSLRLFDIFNFSDLFAINNSGTYLKFTHLKLEEGNQSTDWTPAPEDVDQQISDKVDTKTLESANIDDLRTQGHYFVKSLTGNPLGSGWVYVDVTGNNNDRIRQDVYQDNGNKHMYRRLFGSSWSGWEQSAYLSDVNAAKTEVTASVKNLGDRVTTQVNSITAKVDNLQIGGRNLLKNTDKDISITSHTTDEQPAWAKYETGYNLENGKTYTLSAEIKNSASAIKEASIGIFDGATNVGTVYPLLANGQRQSVTFSVPNDSSKYQLYFYAGHAGEIPGVDLTTTFHHVKLEIGNKATDWTPAPEDTTDIISELNTKWDVANGQIQGKVTEKQVHDLLNKEHYATESWTQAQLKLTSDNFNVSVGKMAQKLDNLTIGGRNLIYGTTDFELLYSGTFTDSITIRQVLIDNELAQKASTMTYSATIRPADMDGPVQLAIYKTKGDSAHTRVSDTPIAISSTVHYGDSKRLSLTFDLDQDMKEIEIVALETGPQTFKMFGVKEEKLEIGSVPTDWSPAPEEYAKTSNIISTINMSPEQIKLSSNKIVLDGDTEIKGTAFIPSAAIKDITADKITAGTLDVGKLDIKNLKADDIKTGTLSGITVRAGDEDSFFQTSKDNIYWITKSSGSALIGRGKYVRYPGLNVFDKEAIYLGSWAGAVLNQDGTINDRGGAYGNPKLAIETAGMKTRFNGYSFGGDLEPKPLDRHRITSWVGPKEFLLVEQGNGTHIELNPNMASSQFTVQKDNKFGAYFGQGREGNEINFTPLGGMTINGNFRVTGAKNAIVKTSQGTVAINAYETADYYFGDIGSAKTGDSKVAMIDIESLFKETVNTDVEYQVFLTSYGPGDIWVSERQRDYFVVESELPNMQFGWEIKAKRKGYENTRLAKVDVSNVPTV